MGPDEAREYGLIDHVVHRDMSAPKAADADKL